MTNKLEISRELAERITNNKYLDKERISIARHEALFELRALLAVPVVDRQELPSEAELIAAGFGYPMSKEEAVKAYKDSLLPRTDHPSNEDCEWCAGCGHDYYGEPCIGCCKPAAKVVERQEPVAWRGLNSLGEVVTEWIDGAPPEKMVDLCGNPSTFEKIERAYTSPPEPVAVAINENAEFEKWRNEQIAVLVRNGYPDGAKAFRELGSVQWAGWQARAGLDKVKVLNQ